MYYTFKLKNGERLKVFHQDIQDILLIILMDASAFGKDPGKTTKSMLEQYDLIKMEGSSLHGIRRKFSWMNSMP